MSSYLSGAEKFSMGRPNFSRTQNNYHSPVHYTSSSSNNSYSDGAQHNQVGYTGENGTIHPTPPGPQRPGRAPPRESQSTGGRFGRAQETSPPIPSTMLGIEGAPVGPSSEKNDNHSDNGISGPGPIPAAPSAPPQAQQAAQPNAHTSLGQVSNQSPNSGHSHLTPSALTIEEEWQAYQADARAERAGILPLHLIPLFMAQYMPGGNGSLPSTVQHAPPQSPAQQGGAVPANQSSSQQQSQFARPEISPVQHSEALFQANPETLSAALNMSETEGYNDNVHALFPPPPSPEVASGQAQSQNGFAHAESPPSPAVASSSGNAVPFTDRTQGRESDGEDTRRMSAASIQMQDVELANARAPSLPSSHTTVGERPVKV